MDEEVKPDGGRTDTREVVGLDQEVWVRQRLYTMLQMAFDLQRARTVQADDPAFQSAINGLLNGTAVEVIHTLGMRPGYENLPEVPHIINGIRLEKR